MREQDDGGEAQQADQGQRRTSGVGRSRLAVRLRPRSDDGAGPGVPRLARPPLRTCAPGRGSRLQNAASARSARASSSACSRPKVKAFSPAAAAASPSRRQ